MQDLEVTVYDGKYHPVDSKEIAFVFAGRNAFLDAIHNAGPQILEPIVSVDITVSDADMGDVTGNLAGRRARISGTESLSGNQVTIKADMPLSSLSDYHTELKSMTQGQAATPWSSAITTRCHTLCSGHWRKPTPRLKIEADLIQPGRTNGRFGARFCSSSKTN